MCYRRCCYPSGRKKSIKHSNSCRLCRLRLQTIPQYCCYTIPWIVCFYLTWYHSWQQVSLCRQTFDGIGRDINVYYIMSHQWAYDRVSSICQIVMPNTDVNFEHNRHCFLTWKNKDNILDIWQFKQLNIKRPIRVRERGRERKRERERKKGG